MPSSIRSRKSAHGQEKYTTPLITTTLMSQHGAHITSTTNSCLVEAAPFSRFFPRSPSTFVVHVHGCLRALSAELGELARSLKWGSVRLPPLYRRQTGGLAKTVCCWLHVVGIRQRGEVGEAQTRRERISVLAPYTLRREEAASLPRGWCIYVERKHKST